MQQWSATADPPPGWGRSAVTIGVFDGLHRGHQELVRRVVALAAEGGLRSVVLTFDPHPAEVLRPGSHPPLLTPLERKAELLAASGVDGLCVLPFTLERSRQDPEDFVTEILVGRLRAAAVVVGANFTYGARASGTVETLAEAGRRHGFTVEVVPLHGSATEDFSSTRVRGLLEAGDVTAAAQVLGREHEVWGVVVPGDRRGRGLGYPTANIAPQRWSALPAEGVYAGRLRRLPCGPALPAAVSIGSNPTFGGHDVRVEAHVLDFDDDLYGQPVALAFTERLRPTLRFASPEELVAQMAADVERTRRLLGPAGA